MIIKLASDFRFLLAVWIVLFIATAASAGLNMRNLLAAFFAWLGGIVTARITEHRQIRRYMKEWEKSYDRVPSGTR